MIINSENGIVLTFNTIKFSSPVLNNGKGQLGIVWEIFGLRINIFGLKFGYALVEIFLTVNRDFFLCTPTNSN